MVSSIKDIKDGAPTTIKEGSPTTKRQGFNQGLYNKTWQKPRRKGRDFSQHPTWVKNSRGEFLRGIKSEEIQHVFPSTHQTCRVSERFIGYPSYRTLTQEVQKHRWCCWWKKSCTTKDDDYPIIYRVLYIPGGLKCRVSLTDVPVLTTRIGPESDMCIARTPSPRGAPFGMVKRNGVIFCGSVKLG